MLAVALLGETDVVQRIPEKEQFVAVVLTRVQALVVTDGAGEQITTELWLRLGAAIPVR